MKVFFQKVKKFFQIPIEWYKNKKECQKMMLEQGLKIPFLTPRQFGVVSIIVLVVIFFSVLVMAQEKNVAGGYWYQAGLGKVQLMDKPPALEKGTKVNLWVFVSRQTEKDENDPNLYLDRTELALKKCNDWGLVIQDVLQLPGAKGVRGVQIHPVTAESDSTKEYILTLVKALQAESKNSAKADSILFSLITSRQIISGQKSAAKTIWGYVEKKKFTASIGASYILIERNEFLVPLVKVAHSWGVFGLEAEGGMTPTGTKGMGNGLWGAGFFIRPCQLLKVGVGYEGASYFFQSDITWQDRYDCLLVKSELEFPLGKKHALNYSLGALKAAKWGLYSTLTISRNW